MMAIAAHNCPVMAPHNTNKQLQWKKDHLLCGRGFILSRSYLIQSVYRTAGLYVVCTGCITSAFRLNWSYGETREHQNISDHVFNQIFNLSKRRIFSLFSLFLPPTHTHQTHSKLLLKDPLGSFVCLPPLTCLCDKLDTSGVSPRATGHCVRLPTASACFCSIFHRCYIFFPPKTENLDPPRCTS